MSTTMYHTPCTALHHHVYRVLYHCPLYCMPHCTYPCTTPTYAPWPTCYLCHTIGLPPHPPTCTYAPRTPHPPGAWCMHLGLPDCRTLHLPGCGWIWMDMEMDTAVANASRMARHSASVGKGYRYSQGIAVGTHRLLVSVPCPYEHPLYKGPSISLHLAPLYSRYRIISTPYESVPIACPL